MNIGFLTEPELEFGSSGTHIDVRFGLSQYGPLDVDDKSAPSNIKVGIVGTNETIEGLQNWLEKGKSRIEAKESRLHNLFPPFPGFSSESCFKSTIEYSDKWSVAIQKKEIDGLIASDEPDQLLDAAVDFFIQAAEDIVSRGGPMVLICAPPQDLFAALDHGPGNPSDPLEEEIDEGSETKDDRTTKKHVFFHDLLKAKGMRLGIPIQLIRPHTYTGQRVRATKGKIKLDHSLQDEATRAWNFHTALYYKAGGIPWRLLRSQSALTTCYVGISFYRSLEGDRLLTSVAQIFNERGEGIIIEGGQAELDKDDKTPHLSGEDAKTLLKNAIQTYRREHRTVPARVVVHKTSKMSHEEIEGFETATKEERVDSTDLLSVRRSLTRLFRESTYPPLRGTFLQLEERRGLIYLRGSVNFFEAYPGLYVPRPLEFHVHKAEATDLQLAREVFSLSKLNWNNTQFDGGEPITVRAARHVGDILKCIPEDENPQPAFRYYM